MNQRLPFTVSVRPWSELSEKERDFFCFSDDEAQFPSTHATQIALLTPADAVRPTSWMFAAMPEGWPTQPGTGRQFKFEVALPIRECWGDPVRLAEVRRWLFDLGIPFRRIVYLIYAPNRVVQTTWRMVVRYWDVFTWPVGNVMVAADHTLQWACRFHHEDVIIFSSQSEARRAGPPHDQRQL